MMRAGLVFNEPRYIASSESGRITGGLRAWTRSWWGPAGRPYRLTAALGAGFRVVLLYEKTGIRRISTWPARVASFITTKATAHSEGALGHWGGNCQLWVDTLYMACPLLSHLSGLTSDAHSSRMPCINSTSSPSIRRREDRRFLAHV